MQLPRLALDRARHALGLGQAAIGDAAAVAHADQAIVTQGVAGGDVAAAFFLERHRQMCDLVPLAGVARDIQLRHRTHRLLCNRCQRQQGDERQQQAG
ncbi:hypothetical protein DXO397_18415, partial [Xanthomonas oryzae pv. oryzae]